VYALKYKGNVQGQWSALLWVEAGELPWARQLAGSGRRKDKKGKKSGGWTQDYGV